jgi:hypothetical protein
VELTNTTQGIVVREVPTSEEGRIQSFNQRPAG